MTYYTQSVSDGLDQGDILAPTPLKPFLPWWPDETPKALVIVTPTCDLAQEKAEHHRLCVLQPLPLLLYLVGKQLGFVKDHWDGALPVSRSKAGDLKAKLGQAVRNAWPRFHFLPSESGIFETDYLVDFEIIVTVPLGALSGLRRHAHLNAPYQQELIQRLTSHLMRIGTPDLGAERVKSTVEGCLQGTQLRFES